MQDPMRLCPKCGHARSVTEAAPQWQCPACGIAYDKYLAYLQSAKVRARALVKPPGVGEPAPAVAFDGSVCALFAANALAIGIALWQGWGAAPLMLLYWGQSVVIGVSNVFRMLALERFSTENFTMNNRPVEPTPATKIQVAGFFAVHYGLFHVVYFVFLVFADRGAVVLDPWFWGCTAVFGLNHLWSHRYNRELDRQGTPNIGTLMFTPYLRIVPMHLTIIFGGLFAGGPLALLMFGALKTVADVVMHLVEHAQLQKVRGARAARS